MIQPWYQLLPPPWVVRSAVGVGSLAAAVVRKQLQLPWESPCKCWLRRSLPGQQ